MKASSKRQLWGLIFVLPAFIFVIFILFIPTLNTTIISFTNYSFIKGTSTNFNGIHNYASIFKDDEFVQSLLNTFLFTGVTVFFELLFGLLLALAINRSFAFRGLMRTTILFPWMLPTALNAIVWRWLYNSDFGFFNNFLRALHIITKPINWLGTIHMAMNSMMFVAIWKTSSFMALIMLTGLQTISKELYEASRIDGANRWQVLFRITLPLLVPSILVALLFRSMDAFRAFELPFALTQGGPAGTTQTLSLYGYRQFFQFLKFNTGSAVSVVQFVLILILGLFYMRILKVEKD